MSEGGYWKTTMEIILNVCINVRKLGIEAIKWQIALRPVQSISFTRAFKAILAGTCIASFTPNRVGEYLGRMLFVDPGNKITFHCPHHSLQYVSNVGYFDCRYLWEYTCFLHLPFHFEAELVVTRIFQIVDDYNCRWLQSDWHWSISDLIRW